MCPSPALTHRECNPQPINQPTTRIARCTSCGSTCMTCTGRCVYIIGVDVGVRVAGSEGDQCGGVRRGVEGCRWNARPPPHTHTPHDTHTRTHAHTHTHTHTHTRTHTYTHTHTHTHPPPQHTPQAAFPGEFNDADSYRDPIYIA